MIFKKKEEVREPFTVEYCQSCKKETKRKFKEGDYLFQESSNCHTCQSKMIIVKIFGEVIQE